MMFERTIPSVWMLPKVTGKYSGSLNLRKLKPVQVMKNDFVETLIGHYR